jgi:hypothetical protein
MFFVKRGGILRLSNGGLKREDTTMKKLFLLPLYAMLAVTAIPTTPAQAGGYLEDVGNATVDVLPNAGRRGAEAANALAADLGPVGGVVGGAVGATLGLGEGVFNTFIAIIGAD